MQSKNQLLDIIHKLKMLRRAVVESSCHLYAASVLIAYETCPSPSSVDLSIHSDNDGSKRGSLSNSGIVPGCVANRVGNGNGIKEPPCSTVVKLIDFAHSTFDDEHVSPNDALHLEKETSNLSSQGSHHRVETNTGDDCSTKEDTLGGIEDDEILHDWNDSGVVFALNNLIRLFTSLKIP
jgi:hypothetical protein